MSRQTDAPYIPSSEPTILPPERALPDPAMWEPRVRWEPFLKTIGAELVPEFEWKAQTGTIQTYEHRKTFRYIHIEGETGIFYDQRYNVITQEAALAHAMPPVAAVVEEPGRAAKAESVAATAEPASSGVADVGLDSFLRTQTMENAAQDDVAANELPRMTPRHWSKGISKAFAMVRQGLFQTRSRDFQGVAEGVRFGEPGREHQEPSLATFLRRSTKLER